MGVDVINVGAGDATIFHGLLNAALGALLIRIGDVVGVAGHPEADDFGIDIGVAGQGVVQFLQYQDAGAFGHDKTGALEIKGTAGGLRVVVVTDGQGPHAVKGRHGPV